jgi:hypothetical protein
MKKAILAIMVCVGACTIMKAQVPEPPQTPSGYTLRGINKQYPPLAPATLLLLGLGASTVGYRVYRNQKQNND